MRTLKLKNWIANQVNRLPFWKRGQCHMLFITTGNNEISQSQIFPYYFYQTELSARLGVTFEEIDIEEYKKNIYHSNREVNIVMFQPWWDISRESLRNVLAQIKNQFKSAKIVFLDSYAPLDVRHAANVEGDIDLYVKKHVFKDRSTYGQPTLGDTNLIDYYAQQYSLQYDMTTFEATDSFLDKLVVGPSFVTSEELLPKFKALNEVNPSGRDIDVHARLGVKGTDWYSKMRGHAIDSIKSISETNKLSTLTDGSVGKRKYFKEMERSKICFSPFGYGEVCWRDYEAILTGAMLVKPDMSHVETNPNIFRPHYSYIPVRWDLSDLEDTIKYYLSHSEERNVIALNAFNILKDYVTAGAFVDHVEDIIKRVAGAPSIKKV